MPHCAREVCGRWRPVWLSRHGLRFDGDWFCSATCLADETARLLAALQPPQSMVVPGLPRVRLGATLLASRAITADVLERALADQRQTGLKLGAQLLLMGAVGEDTITQALARQAGIGLLTAVDTERVLFPVGGLSRVVIEALGVVPFEAENDGTLRVAVTAPVPRVAIAALQSGAGARVRPYMVSDSLLQRLLARYGTGGQAVHTPHERLSAAQAARRIADAARAGRAARWQHTWGPGFAWIRLDGDAGHEDLIVTPSRQEQAWQAAPTRH